MNVHTYHYLSALMNRISVSASFWLKVNRMASTVKSRLGVQQEFCTKCSEMCWKNKLTHAVNNKLYMGCNKRNTGFKKEK